VTIPKLSDALNYAVEQLLRNAFLQRLPLPWYISARDKTEEVLFSVCVSHVDKRFMSNGKITMEMIMNPAHPTQSPIKVLLTGADNRAAELVVAEDGGSIEQ
jgi:hypothetical protein